MPGQTSPHRLVEAYLRFNGYVRFLKYQKPAAPRGKIVNHCKGERISCGYFENAYPVGKSERFQKIAQIGIAYPAGHDP